MSPDLLGHISFSWEFIAALLSIVLIDLILAGDNAVIIAMAVRSLPRKQRQKGILIGAKGEALRRVGASARMSIEEFLQRKVYLELHVKVRENWRDNEQHLRSLGYRVD